MHFSVTCMSSISAVPDLCISLSILTQYWKDYGAQNNCGYPMLLFVDVSRVTLDICIPRFVKSGGINFGPSVCPSCFGF